MASILALVTLATTIYLLTARDPTPTLETPGNMAAFEYETVPGIFRQSDSATDVDSYDYVLLPSHFLLHHSRIALTASRAMVDTAQLRSAPARLFLPLGVRGQHRG